MEFLHDYFAQVRDFLPEPVFNTRAFLTFFAAVFVLYWLVPRRRLTVRVWLLVVASFHVYAAWSQELAFLVTATSCADYLFGRLMAATGRRRVRIAVVLTSIVMNLGVLSYFKYRGFFLNELHDALARLGCTPGFDRLDAAAILVPFGISFYTFEAISYAVDVYRGRVKAETSLPRFLLFILFFPHLVSGPIVRAADFLRQARRPHRWNWLRVQVGVQLFLVGAFKKMAIADRMALFCDTIMKDPAAYSTGACWAAVLAYSVRIYCDFSGYSDMAVGLAHLFGYRLTNNFNLPYLAANVGEFWRRWHISLSTWLRDYVFIPLGGNRHGHWATCRNLLITMLLGGLWHGAAWGYVMWGLVHGLLLVGHRGFAAAASRLPQLESALQTLLGTGLRVLVTFLCVSLCWVLFQPDIGRAFAMYGQLFHLQGGQPLPLSNRSLWYAVVLLLSCQLLVRSGAWDRLAPRLPAAVMGVGYAVCLCTAMLLDPDSSPAFIYFQF